MDEGTIQAVAALILAFGGGAGFKALMEGLYRLVTGKQRKEQSQLERWREDYEGMRRERDFARQSESRAYYRLRIMEEHAAACRRVIIHYGGKTMVPDFPVEGHPWHEHKSIYEIPPDYTPPTQRAPDSDQG